MAFHKRLYKKEKEVVTMDEKMKKAMEYHQRGFNCCQAVACTYCEEVGVDEDIMFKMAEGFGAGMGGMESTCGAVSGAVMLAGLKNSQGSDMPVTKGKTYQLSREIVKQFEEKNGSLICKELKGVGTNRVLRSCDGCIQDAVMIARKVLFE